MTSRSEQPALVNLAGTCYDLGMPKTKTLTTAQATNQAASKVRRLMAGSMVTAQSRGSWDLSTDTALVITTITFPPTHPAALDARAALRVMPGVRSVRMDEGYITITRER